ncbi:MAG: hypothetical protein H8E38_02390 [SAR324 cluster bacterium]|nr:hypothetical protein [SAR324 cluster bacterium]MBL7034683.1 hypothetical protein [SAR324 cluster bacterium]
MEKFMRRYLVLQCIFALIMTTAQAEEAVFWKDRQISQLEQLTPSLVEAVQSMQSKISSVAISSISYGDALPASFRKVANARLQQTLTNLLKLKVSICEPCSQIRTDISGSFLKISRGIADDKYRREAAKELNVKGFLDIAIFTSDGDQLSISLNAYEAKDGEIVFSKIVTGMPPKSGSYIHAFYGKMTVPITYTSTSTGSSTSVDHQARVLGAEKMVRLTDDWSFTGGGAMLSDDNSNLTEKYEKAITGFLIDGTISYDVFNFGGDQVALSMIAGLGMMTVTPFNNPSYFKTGFSFSVAEQLTLNYHYLAMLTTDTSATASGASIISIGWKF